ncbi:MAG: two-component system sensor histidine kinase NtrB [Planctomycetia bacterium]
MSTVGAGTLWTTVGGRATHDRRSDDDVIRGGASAMAIGDDDGRARPGVYHELAALVGALAHEIRNPLSTIKLNMDLLAEDFETADPASPTKQRDRRARAKIDVVRQECDRLQKLLGDFLDFARQESLHLEPGSLNSEVEQLLDFFHPRAEEAQVEVVRYLDPELPAVRLDRDSFRSAVLNLLINAVQALDGCGQIVVRTRPSGLGVVLELIDTGPGMDEETLAKVFRAFYSTKQGGSGLGLPTARKIIEAHGGTIDVESAPGRGTRVTIWLPAPPRLPTAEPAAGHASAAGQRQSGSRGTADPAGYSPASAASERAGAGRRRG